MTKSAVIDSAGTFEGMTDSAMRPNRKYRLMRLFIAFRQAQVANLAASHGTTPADGYREFYFGLAKPGQTDHPADSAKHDMQPSGFAYANTAAFTLQFPNGAYEIVYEVDIPDDFDLWLFDTSNGISVQVHSSDSPPIGQDTIGAPVGLLEVEIDAYLVQAKG